MPYHVPENALVYYDWVEGTFVGGRSAQHDVDYARKRIVMTDLLLYHDYTRKQVHEIFAPHAPFTPQAGTWGLQGIIAIPNRFGDFVLFVTFGQQQGQHIFEEGITADGVLSWQSQPKQALRDRQIQQLIQHDALSNTIYLFLRTRKKGPYTYLGTLHYLTHDAEREYPVWFQWQILNWHLPHDIQQRIGLVLQPALLNTLPARIDSPPGTLYETSPPSPQARQGQTTATFRAHKVADYAANDARNRALGLAGELLVVHYEQASLRQQGRPDLAARVRHVAHIEGDGVGYDILSYTADGIEKYIEVKTTTGGAESAFYMTSHEVAFAKQRDGDYYLYRVYDFNQARNTGKVYISRGHVESSFQLMPVQYRVTPL